ncbi:hypothetical protein [Spirillospora sp. NBC_01491]|uniref:hypothetical protein n=1 Tax=Spirillospora sp. NBC_01491 TaxID=2976007 RepID=UPI002E324C62|nr:hypothetical protein [Spirillospora sp. NBC_01491]
MSVPEVEAETKAVPMPEAETETETETEVSVGPPSEPAAEPPTLAVPVPAPSIPEKAAGPPAAPPAPPARAPSVRTGGGGSTWHRLHLPIGAFLIAYGVTVLLTAALTWGDRRAELEDYFSSGAAGPALMLVKAAEALLVLAALAAVLRRRDVWLVPPLAGWMAGFAMFSVLDVLGGDLTRLLEHCAYLVGFVALLFLAYGLSAKVQVARAAPGPGGTGPGGGLTRTQEFALSAISRLQRGGDAASAPSPASATPPPRP